MSTPRFAHIDTKQPDGFYIQFVKLIEDDDSPWDGDTKRPRHVLSVRAEARCLIVRRGVGTFMNLQSAGLYGVGVNRMSDPYLEEVYAEEKADLLDTLEAMHDPIVEFNEENRT